MSYMKILKVIHKNKNKKTSCFWGGRTEWLKTRNNNKYLKMLPTDKEHHTLQYYCQTSNNKDTCLYIYNALQHLVHLDWEGTVVLWHNCVIARRPWQKIQAFACSPHISVQRHEFGLNVHSTLAIGVNVNVNGCLSLCVSPVINGVHPGHVIYLTPCNIWNTAAPHLWRELFWKFNQKAFQVEMGWHILSITMYNIHKT